MMGFPSSIGHPRRRHIDSLQFGCLFILETSKKQIGAAAAVYRPLSLLFLLSLDSTILVDAFTNGRKTKTAGRLRFPADKFYSRVYRVKTKTRVSS